jgi:hypothetical protein
LLRKAGNLSKSEYDKIRHVQHPVGALGDVLEQPATLMQSVLHQVDALAIGSGFEPLGRHRSVVGQTPKAVVQTVSMSSSLPSSSTSAWAWRP